MSPQYLGLGGSYITGTIPSWIGRLSALSYLEMQYSSLSGTIPSALGMLQNLQQLYLGQSFINNNNNNNNNMNNNMNMNNNNNGQRMMMSVFSQGYLTGTIPPQLGWLSRLQALDVGGNLLTGPIPTSLGYLNSLSTMSLTQSYPSDQRNGVCVQGVNGECAPGGLTLSNNFLTGTVAGALKALTMSPDGTSPGPAAIDGTY